MPKYTCVMQIFLGTGDELEIEAKDERIAELVAKRMCEERFDAGAYDKQIDITEICTSSIFLSPGQEELALAPAAEPWSARGMTADLRHERALELLDDLVRQIDDVHNPIPYDLHERVQAIKNALKGE